MFSPIDKQQSATQTVETDLSSITAIKIEQPAISRIARLFPVPLQPWIIAFQKIWPTYLATHIAFILLTYVAQLYLFSGLHGFAETTILARSWVRWDTNHFLAIAREGYVQPLQAAFFPLYPFLEYLLSFVTGSQFLSGIIIANIATLFLFMVLYRLASTDFNDLIARRTVLFMAIFPTAFFLVAAYNESLFLCLTLCCFYYIRRGHWWLAGIFGFFAALTRSAGLILLIPFCFEYLQKRHFRLSAIRYDCLAALLIPLGVGVFSLYCYYLWNDFLAFSHAQSHWGRELHFPWMTFVFAIQMVASNPPVNPNTIHIFLDMGSALLAGILIVLSIVGPWRFSKQNWTYIVYAGSLYIFLLSFPTPWMPVQSLGRLVIELFPMFIVLATISSKKESFQTYYMVISTCLMSFLLVRFLSGGWVV